MPRKNKNAKKRYYINLTLRQLCKKAGISPKQRIIMARNIKNATKGGEV